MRDLEDPCENCGVEEGEAIVNTADGELFVCIKCHRRLKKLRKKVNHGSPPVE